MLHTVGLHANGRGGSLDYGLELAYQFGPAPHRGAMFKLSGCGDTDAVFNSLGADAKDGDCLCVDSQLKF